MMMSFINIGITRLLPRFVILIFLVFIFATSLVTSRKIPVSDTENPIQFNLGHKKYLREKVPTLSRIVIKCNFDNLSWFKNSEKYLGDPKRTKIFDRIKESDAGTYACKSSDGEWSNLTLSVIPGDERKSVIDDKYSNFANSMEIHSQVSDNVDLSGDNDTDYYLEPEIKEEGQEEEEEFVENGTSVIAHSPTSSTSENPDENHEKLPYFLKPDSLPSLVAKPSGNMIRLKCPAGGNPEPTLSWTKNGEPINRSIGQARFSRWALILEDLVPPDSGIYVCHACNSVGCTNFTTKLEVKERFPAKPYIKEGYPKNVTALVNSSITFECSTISDLADHIIWAKYLPSNSSDNRVNHKPIITHPPVNLTLHVGENATMQCIVLSDLHHHMQWISGLCEKSCSENISIKKRDSDNPQVLKLENITHADEGWYTCIAANSLGFSNASAYLQVLDEYEDIPLSAPVRTPPMWLNILSIVLGLLFIVAIVFMYLAFKKFKHEKLVMKHRMQTVHQWNKKVIVLKPAPDNIHPEAMLMPIIKIEKQRTTQIQSPNNDPLPISEYEFPMDSNWEFLRNQLVLGKTLGEGAFGRVVMAEANGLMKNGCSTVVAVKMVKEGHTDSDMASLVHEMEVMKMIGKHINIINLLGCCSQGGPLYVIVEYAPHGNLKDFLKKNRPRSEFDIPFITNEEEERKNLTQKHLISFAYQVARGMEYLASRRCIHRDLAARNVLVSDDYIMKIADFGLARDIQNTDYYRKATNGRLPIKWMAPESLTDKFYDTKSDVWSYGILLWEIMSFGEQPYPSIYSADDLNIFLRSDHRLEKPRRCSNNIYMLMRQCWQFNPQDRPDFTQLVVDLDKILSATANDEYLDLGVPVLETPPSSDDESDNEVCRELLH